MWCSCEKQNCDSGSLLKKSDSPCIHFWACIAVFASNDRLSEEFGFFIALQHELTDNSLTDNSLNQVITLLGQDEHGETIQVEVLDDDHFRNILSTEDDGAGQVLDANLLGEDIQIESA